MEFSDDNASLKSNLLRSSFLPSTKLRNEGEVLKIWIILDDMKLGQNLVISTVFQDHILKVPDLEYFVNFVCVGFRYAQILEWILHTS